MDRSMDRSNTDFYYRYKIVSELIDPYMDRYIIDTLSIQKGQKLSIQKEAKIKAEGGIATEEIAWIDNRYRSMDRPTDPV